MSPEAYAGGTIGFLKDGDEITIDIPGRKMSVGLSDRELEDRRRSWKPLEKLVAPGYLASYRKLVQSAARGTVLG